MLHVSHDYPLIRSWGIRHEKRLDVDEGLYQHCVKKLLVGYLKPPIGEVRSLKIEYNVRHAHPYRWTYTGEPLVRDTPFSRTRRQQRQGRACFSSRPKRLERLFYAPRPYRRQAA